MARIYLGATGPSFHLGKEDLSILHEKNRIFFPLNDSDKIFGNLILTSYSPNKIDFHNGNYGVKDSFCSEEYLLKRIKKRGVIEYFLKAQKDYFFNSVDKFLRKEIELMGSRCKYDRFHIIID